MRKHSFNIALEILKTITKPYPEDYFRAMSILLSGYHLLPVARKTFRLESRISEAPTSEFLENLLKYF